MPVFREVTDAQSGTIKLEALHQPLYDSATVTAAGIISLFQNPGGRGLLAVNVTTAGQLSWPKRFSIKALRQVALIALFADLQSYLLNTLFRVQVGEKNYLTVPAFMVSAGTGVEAQLLTGAAAPVAPANGLVYANHGRPDHRNLLTLMHTIYIPPVQNFVVSLESAAAMAVGTPFAIWVFLEGELLREIQ
jgi:hypothetical protein